MFGNDLSLSSGESYHALENASRSQTHGFLVLGQISVHGTWRTFLLPCGLVCCEEVCNFWTYLKNTEERKMAIHQTDGMHNVVLVVLKVFVCPGVREQIST